MTEAELKEVAAALAKDLELRGVQSVEYIDEGPLEGEPASICIEFQGHSLVLGVLPL